MLHREEFYKRFGIDRTTIEEMSMNGWSAIKVMHFRGSVLRFSEGYTKRSNSVNLLHFLGDPDELIETAEREYPKRGLPVVFKLLHEDEHEGFDSLLAAKGYEAKDATTVRIAELHGASLVGHSDVSLEKGIPQNWIDQFVDANHLEKRRKTVEAVLNHISLETISAAVWNTEKSRALGFGLGALEGAYVGCFNIFIRQEARGQGYGRAIMESLLAAAKNAGAERAYLQVLDNNTAAKGLYDSMGFFPVYKYHYRIKENP